MVDQKSDGDDAAGKSSRSAARDWLRTFGRALSRGARAMGEGMAGRASRVGNWLVSIGWGKFILLSILVLALTSMVDEAFNLSQPHKRKHAKANPPVEVKISVDSDGLHIYAPTSGPPKPAPPTVGGPGKPAESKVQIDDKGIRIRKHKDGHDETLVIDDKGVRVEEAPPAPPGSPKSPEVPAVPGKSAAESKSTQVTVPPGVLSDPDKVSEAVEAAKGEIEDIVRDQINTRVTALSARAENDTAPWPDLADLALMLLFTLLITKIALGSKRRAESRAQAADAVAAEEGLKRQLAEAQLKTLQAQVEPHFLFNTLASVDYLIDTDPARASKMQKNLIQYLRAAVPQMRQASSTLGQEMALCRSYLEILKVRMEDRLQFAITMPAGLSTAAFPPMMLQTLVENSIKHGLEPKPEGGTLTLNADVVDGNLRVAVSDTGLGFGAAGLGGGGVGLNNVRERLQAVFGARGRLTVEPNSPGGTIATIVIPYSVGTAEAAPQAAPQPA
jgi:two-component sensor histidine kinase